MAVIAEPKKIIVFRTDRIGDLVVSTPVFREIKQAFPSCRLSVCVSRASRDVILNNPHIDSIHIRTDDDSIGNYRDDEFDTAVALFSDKWVMRTIRRSRIPNRIGPLSGIGSYFCYNHGMRQRRSASVRHEAQYNLELLTPLGITATDTRPEIFLADEERNEAAQILKEAGIGRPFACVHPGMGNSALNWPLEYYAIVMDRIRQDFEVEPVLTGGPADQYMVDAVSRACSCEPASLLGRTSLRQLAAVFERAEFVIAPSTGPLHIASVLGRLTFSVYSPIQVHSVMRWGPLGANSHTRTPQVVCGCKYTCSGKVCPDFFCMKSVTPEDMLQLIQHNYSGNRHS